MNLGVFLPLQFLGIVSEGQVTFSKFDRTMKPSHLVMDFCWEFFFTQF